MGIKKIHTNATCAINPYQWTSYPYITFRSKFQPLNRMQSQITTITNHITVFPYLLIPMKDIIYYYLLIRYYIIWDFIFLVLKFLIMILWFVTCVIAFAPFCICKDTKYNQKYKILNVWKNIIYKLTFCAYDDYKQLINDNSLTLYNIIAPLQTK